MGSDEIRDPGHQAGRFPGFTRDDDGDGNLAVPDVRPRDHGGIRHRGMLVARGLEAAAVTGDEGATAWHDRMRALRDTFSQAISRLRRIDGLNPRWTVATATDWVWAHAHVSTYHHLVDECGWRPADYTRHTVRTLLGELLR